MPVPSAGVCSFSPLKEVRDTLLAPHPKSLIALETKSIELYNDRQLQTNTRRDHEGTGLHIRVKDRSGFTPLRQKEEEKPGLYSEALSQKPAKR